ncbi:hypothetical protein [Amycolatopsis albispora]|uniref:Lipoprotein n=1 Tax=Amycolatopsis albispora TaxID=1804986 RepID=A0A344L413_9PSEU|nr:hypothetical protein [Amycolatopsis albispora]AXB42787.1 hypothetical protein A4R43_09795 [Amycolatopsis albispora]
MKRVRTVPLVAAGLAALALTACGTQAGEGTGTADAAAPASPAVTTPAEPTTADGHTSPGMRLKFGERALLPVGEGETAGTIAITVTGIEPGTPADLKNYQPDQVAGVTPYFIKYTVEHVKGGDLGGTGVALRGLYAGGERPGVALLGGTDNCQKTAAPRSGKFAKPGDKFDACQVYGGKDGGAITMAEFNLADAYRKNPVLWG